MNVSESPLWVSCGENVNPTVCPAAAGLGLPEIESLVLGGCVGVGVGVGVGAVPEVVNDQLGDVLTPHEPVAATCQEYRWAARLALIVQEVVWMP